MKLKSIEEVVKNVITLIPKTLGDTDTVTKIKSHGCTLTTRQKLKNKIRKEVREDRQHLIQTIRKEVEGIDTRAGDDMADEWAEEIIEKVNSILTTLEEEVSK